MSVQSLQNITVPTDIGTPSALIMPKLQYRFRVLMRGFGQVQSDTGDETRIFTRQVIDVTRPNVSFEQITLDTYNSRAYMAGKHTWEPITLNLRDDAGNNIQRLVGSQLQRQFDFYNQASAAAADDYKFETEIQILDGGNGARDVVAIDSFVLYGCYIESANYNQLSYSTNDPVQISLTIRYDNAIQYGNGGEAAVGRNGIGNDDVGTSEFEENGGTVGQGTNG